MHFLSVIGCIGVFLSGAVQQAPLNAPGIAKLAREATVQVRALNDRGQPIASGSGFIVTENGILVTNLHVIEDGVSLQVELASEEIFDNVFFITADARRDIAVLKIPAEKMRVLALGSDADAEVGENVYVMGNPLGLTNTFSNGIVSAKRMMEGVSMLQVTAPISKGSSGGPVLNATGEVIGVATMMLRDGQNLNYAVPVRYIRPLLSTGEKPQRFSTSLLPRPVGAERTSLRTPTVTEPPRPSASPSGSGEEFIKTMHDRMLSMLATRDVAFTTSGYKRSHTMQPGSLKPSESASFPVDVRRGLTYAFFGVCDSDCADLDIALYNPSGRLVEQDIRANDEPLLLLQPTVTGQYRVRVTMAGCSVSPCFYAIGGYQKQ